MESPSSYRTIATVISSVDTPAARKNQRKARYAQDERYKLYQDGKMYDLAADVLEQKPLAYGVAVEGRKSLQAFLDRYEKEAPFGK